MSQLNRKQFIQRVSVAGTGLLLSPYLSSGTNFFSGSPGNKVVIAVMGTNGRGGFLAKTFAQLPDVEVVRSRCHRTGKVD